MTTLTVRAANGTVVAEYPDFVPGTPVRVLPAIVSDQFPTERSIVDDGWSFAGATRHPEYASIHHDRHRVTMAMHRDRLRPRPR